MKVSTRPGEAAGVFYQVHGGRVKMAYVPDPVAWREWDGYGKRTAQMRRTLERDGRFAFTVVEVAQLVYKDALAEGDFNVVCLPGGAHTHFMRALGDRGQEILRAFVRDGGGFIGICAGAYVGSAFGVGLLDVELPCMATNEWKRGLHPTCPFNFSRTAPAVLGADHAGDAVSRYNNVSMMAVKKGAAVDVLANFGDVELRGKHNAFEPFMRGSPAIVTGRCGLGASTRVNS